MKKLFAVTFFCLCLLRLIAQTNEGTAFWLGFMQHFDVNQNTKVLMITSKVNTTGVVRMPLTGWEQSFSVTANGVTNVVLPLNAETTTSELVGSNGVQVSAQAPVSVYMHQYHSMRSEASVVLPQASVGQEYYVLTFNGYGQGASIYPSEFVVVGMEDDTKVDITLSSDTKGGKVAGSTFSVVLNAGQTYQVQSADGATGDMTGTYIHGDKPCNVFAGARWTEVPVGCGTRDNLLEQMYPVETWGKQFVTVPHFNMPYDVFRILAAEDQTVVQVIGSTTQSYTLNKGQFVQYQGAESTYILASKPIAVMQYLIGSSCNGYTVGDPSMVMLNSVQQIRDTVTMFSSSFEAITENYINLITKTVDANFVLFDGQTLANLGVAVQTVGGNPDFSYARLKVSTGAHTMISSGCGLIATAYGYGSIESYAYSGGASFSKLNASPFPDGSCLNDTLWLDTGLRPPRYTFNWDLGDGTSSSAATLGHVYPNLGTYPLQLILHDNCFNTTDTLKKDLLISLRQAVMVSPDQSLCEGETLVLSATDLPGAKYVWQGPAGFYSEDQFPVLNTVTTAQNGTYNAVGIISGCATFPAYTEASVHPLPDPDLGPDTLFCSRTVNFPVVLDAGDFANYRWMNGQASVQTFTARQEGEYWVEVWTEFGCPGSDTIFLREQCPTQVYVPNVFSPNDDGWNDIFSVFGTDIISLHLQIFDRWGSQVFESKELEPQWDGYSQGKPVDPGVYVWVLDVSGYREDGSIYEEVLSGDVTVVR
ncbi:MAG: gliding motility-associated C-terminal domain-containing protein [Lewinellaceae bacterium]|nr:gliding motility-associated C-terminal domain-containing protein [Lewinellaceae bacterium]